MTTESKYQLVSLDESYVSDLSDENQSAVVGGTLGLLFGWLLGGWRPSGGSSANTGTTIVNNNYNTIYVTSSSGAVSGSSDGSSGGPSGGPSKPH